MVALVLQNNKHTLPQPPSKHDYSQSSDLTCVLTGQKRLYGLGNCSSMVVVSSIRIGYFEIPDYTDQIKSGLWNQRSRISLKAIVRK